VNLDQIDLAALRDYSTEQLQSILTDLTEAHERDKQENALRYYAPAGVPDTDGYAQRLSVHTSKARVLGVGGGNGSSKTETVLCDMLMRATGIIPDSLREHVTHEEVMRGPIQCRVVCESLTTVLHTVILRKLKWWEWTGVDEPGGKRGHWGWIPKSHLVEGRWDKSWSEKLRQLRFKYHDYKTGKFKGYSTIQFTSHDQDASDFASGDFHYIMEDEPPNRAIWIENQARTMRVAGLHRLAMTWPDDPAINVDWIFDEIYEPAQGANKDPNTDWINLYTTDNPHLDQESVASQSNSWSEEIRKVRIYGQPIRFSNRIHPLFTDQTQWWCFSCKKTIQPIEGKCSCGTTLIGTFNHVEEIEPMGYPTIWLLDPHPRKPHMFLWVQVTPTDDLQVVAEGEVDGDPVEVKQYVDRVESEMGLRVTRRLIDPNMGRSPSGARRGIVWQDEFDNAGLVTDLADDADVGRGRINQYLEPDDSTLRPRLHVATSCKKTTFQMKRYLWDDHKRQLDKDVKQKPKAKYDDYPTLLKYLMNLDPTFKSENTGGNVYRRRRSAA
jgi:hypothetical protein